MGNYVMFCAIFVCLFAVVLIALAKPLQVFLKLGLSAIAGGCVLFLGKSLGAAVGVNAATLAVSALLGVPGVAGLFVLSFFL
ncbi:MAG: pro-sigmaK processing inhibitor BofA family protein [Anaerotignum sp.]